MDDLKIRIIDKTTEDFAPVVILNVDNGEELEVFDEYLIKDNIENYVLVGLFGYDWNRDLSPWPEKAVFKNGDDFKGEADTYLKKIIEEIIPSLKVKASYYAIGGYSLAGLFALYAGYRCDVFSRIISASGSLWYPGFMDFIKENRLSKNVECVYLSLGDKEAETRNPIMRTVKDNTETVYDSYKDNIKCIFEMNEGNHFKDAPYRLYKGIRYILNT